MTTYPTERIGVMIDLIPTYQSKDGNIDVTEQSKAFFRKCDCDYLLEEEPKFVLLHNPQLDTGHIENTLMTLFDEPVKRGFRVVKYLFQDMLYDPISEGRNVTLYWYAPILKSYYLRVCLFHILF